MTTRLPVVSPIAVRVLEPQLERVHPDDLRHAAQVHLGRERHRRDAEAAHRRRRHAVREDHEAVEAQVGDRVRAGVVERVLREPVGREARVARRRRAASASGGRGSSRRSSPRRGSRRATGARVEETRNSSSRVKRHLTGRCDLIASSAQIVSVAVSTLPPKPPPTVPPTNFSLFSGHCEVRGDDAHREVHRLGAGVDRQPAAGLGHDERDLRLQRHVLDRLRAVDALDDHVGLLERRVDVALAHAAVVVRAEVRIDRAPLVEASARPGRPRCGCRGPARAPRTPPRSRRPRPARPPGTWPRRRAMTWPFQRTSLVGEQRLVGGHAERLEVAVDVVRDVLVR